MIKKIGFTLIIGAVGLLVVFPSLWLIRTSSLGGGGECCSSSFYQQLVAPLI